MITQNELKKFAELAKLNYDESLNIDDLTECCDVLIDADLSQFDLTDAPWFADMREDVLRDSFPTDLLLESAWGQKDGCFMGPKL